LPKTAGGARDEGARKTGAGEVRADASSPPASGLFQFEDPHVNKEQKAAVVDEIAERLGSADAIFAVDYRGISVPEAAELRTKLREADAVFTVVKNRLAKRAAEKAGTTDLDELFDGPIALAFVKGDTVVAAKAISTFSREHDVLEYRGGIMDGEPLDPEKFKAIARLPGLDVLHGQLVGVAASPLTGLTRGLASMLSGLAVGLGQIAEQGLVGGEEEPNAGPDAPGREAKQEPEPDPAAPGRAAEEADGSDVEAGEEPATEVEAEASTEDESEGESDEGSGEPGSGESEAEGEDSEEDEK
jgi:large subunit ribosomal protein L10